MDRFVNSDKRTIVVNASALRSGGALTILRQFVSEIPQDNFEYLIFVDESVSFSALKKNIQIVKVSTRSFIRRFIWDAMGLNNWIKRNHIHPLAAISLQNTNFRLNERCPNFIYYHQPLPFYKNKWSLFRQKERSLWFYKYIYPFFVNLFINSRTEIFVQLEFIRNGFAERFSFDKNKIHVVFPNLEIPQPVPNPKIQIDKEAINLFYPAASIIYKNHQVLIDSLSVIDKGLKPDVVLYLTIGKDELKINDVYKNIRIVFLGKITHEQVVWLYEQVDALVFPSYVETLGLPLIEAASLGLHVIASDLAYSREVLEGYQGVTYVPYNNANEWSRKIEEICSDKNRRFEPFTRRGNKSWKDFFAIIKNSIEK